MMTRTALIALIVGTIAMLPSVALAQRVFPVMFPESRALHIRDAASLAAARLPAVEEPITVRRQKSRETQKLTLNNAVQMALANSEVVRVLGGLTAVNSGRSLYDVAIANTAIDEAHATFDLVVDGRHDFLRNESPSAFFDSANPGESVIGGGRSDDYSTTTGVTKSTITGGDISFRANANRARRQPGTFPLNPETRSSATLSLTQPLLQGGGIPFNLSPIVLARIDTERSYFQLKDAIQETVRGTIQAYWELVQARLDQWTLEQQIVQAEFANRLAQAEFRLELRNSAEAAQASLALSNFKASSIAGKAAVLNREAALRSILGLPPSASLEFVPTTPPTDQEVEFVWEELVALAESQRPDVIELKLVLEADQQLILRARNQAQPRVDALASYRWNGLEGEMPIGRELESEPGQFTDWEFGINFSVPIGLRRSRAGLRRQELVLARDRVNLDQRMLEVVHTLSLNVRNIDLLYSQYEAFRETREAAETNLKVQQASFRRGIINFINVLQAITDWGNAISSEARSLTQYNIALAGLELQTGTILEVHGVRLYEERYCSIGPLGKRGRGRFYPRRNRPNGDEVLRYQDGEKPSEEFFDLEPPAVKTRRRRERREPPMPRDASPSATSEE